MAENVSEANDNNNNTSNKFMITLIFTNIIMYSICILHYN